MPGNKSSKLLLIFLTCCLLVLAGCSNRGARFEQFETEETLREIATTYLTAQYKGDLATLKSITRDEARQAVEKGELDIFKSHKLNEIESFFLQKPEDSITYKIIVTVSSTTAAAKYSSTYYEHIDFTKYDNRWYITKVERDT